MKERKALSMPMEIIIAVVVLVVIALAVIMFTSGSITKTGTQTGAQQDTTACGLCEQNYCVGKAGQTVAVPAYSQTTGVGCKSCPTAHNVVCTNPIS